MPLLSLMHQLAIFAERTGTDVIAPALDLVREYDPEAGGERWIEASDGFVAVHGAPADALGPTASMSKRRLAAELQGRGFAAAPVLTAEEAMADGGLPQRMPATDGMPFRPRRRPRVLDLTHLLAGPFTTFLLSLAGVDVLKIEPPQSGDGLRYGEPAQFAGLNAGKRRITLDVRRGNDLLRRLAERADLVIHNYRGQPFPALPAPTLALPGLAATGPYAGWRSFADTVHAMLGFSHKAGPALLPWADYLAGACAANRALNMLSSRCRESQVFPQAACMPAEIPRAWPEMDRRKARAASVPPLGEHNDVVLGELGLDEEDINQLYVKGII